MIVIVYVIVYVRVVVVMRPSRGGLLVPTVGKVYSYSVCIYSCHLFEYVSRLRECIYLCACLASSDV